MEDVRENAVEAKAALQAAAQQGAENAEPHGDHENTHGDHENQLYHHHHLHKEGSSHQCASCHEHGHHLLQVENLSVAFRMYDPDAPFFKAKQRYVEVIQSLSVSVHAGEILAVVGASGSGKTLLADSVMGLFESNSRVAGTIWFDGVRQDAASLQKLRGHGVSLVPQSVNHLNPLMKVGNQVEGFGFSAEEAAARREKRRVLFERYGLGEDVANLYPFELSGGMARRVLLCCALMDNPKLIIADEPTPGLDLDLALKALADFRSFADEGGGVLLITHDIELALRIADRIAVFQDGTVIEEVPVSAFASPDTLRHPFSKALWYALPEHDFEAKDDLLHGFEVKDGLLRGFEAKDGLLRGFESNDELPGVSKVPETVDEGEATC